MTTFCAEHGISRKTFYAIRARVAADGPAAALEPRSRRPKNSPARLSDDVRQQAIGVRAALERSGLDHGPISVHEKMRSMGLASVPSPASLARMFRQAGVARAEPRKKPRAAFRRFVYPAPNACWQLDATEYVLAGGRKCVIFQLIDDHSRYAVSSHVARSETAEAAIAVTRKGIAAHGVPQRLLTDNGSALNPIRRGVIGQLVIYVTSLGVEPITGRPNKPTTQGKNERFHQTLFRWLDKQPLAETIDQLQEQVDAFDIIYNTQRPHQGLPGRITPLQAWEATPKAEPPRPRPAPPEPTVPGRGAAAATRIRPGVEGTATRVVPANGGITIRGVKFQIGSARTGLQVHIVWDPEGIAFFDHQGTLLIEHLWPAKGITYVSNGRPVGTRPRTDETVTDVLTHEPSPMS
ncbi:IS481 family transposase [Sinomonas sp. ASV322]|uniref:IS481 family transposase n=2 Tax=Sinomonas sp. ASV322 TaxID=3041920 RepID=UPI0027DB6AE6|nr:IS481 family transposase [Sinomonas sp. ASV322]MDQ4503367.1 IS481 family transposase [Sinomonas sp. ASV322]MDQ4504264.1 IS481 family transposase [Sinomonas sp. ASV322]MDQ4504600.1 IS481 family transposase [Sinomonas sp. ASV322]